MYINFWYPICTGAELDVQSPLRAELLGVRLVAFRDTAGNAHVLSDTCVHRGGSLSDGKIAGDCLQCPYHGWEYNGDGVCTKIPSMPGKKMPARAKVDSYPVAEKYGVVFAFLGDLPEHQRPPEPVVGEAGKDGWRVTGPIIFELDGYFERSVENGLDAFHNEFVHPAQGSPPVLDETVNVEDQEWGSSFEVSFGDYKNIETLQRVADTDRSGGMRAGSWHVGPNALMTGIYLHQDNNFVQYFFEAPQNKKHTRVFFINARDNALDEDKDDWVNNSFLNIVAEDRKIIENLRPFSTPDTLTKELLTPGDAPIVHYREFLKTWEKRGWRIDWKALQDGAEDAAFAIPGPARRTSRNWVLDPVPLISAAP